MEIRIEGQECEKILKDYAFVNFGKIMGCEKPEEMGIEIDSSYDHLSKMTITKEELPNPEEKVEESEA